MFAMSPLDLVRQEVERLWNLSESYRAAYLLLPGSIDRVLAEHEEMIGALEALDLERLVDLADGHRANAEAIVSALLPEREP
jgi:DNA-binding GntR family transcriptional regulator